MQTSRPIGFFRLYHAPPTTLRETESASELMEFQFGDVSLSEAKNDPKWESEALQMAPTSGTIEFRWKDQGFGIQKGRIFLRLMAPSGKEKAIFPLTEDFASHHWDNITVELQARNPVIALATVGCYYQVVVEVGYGGGHRLHVESFVLRLAGEDINVFRGLCVEDNIYKVHYAVQEQIWSAARPRTGLASPYCRSVLCLYGHPAISDPSFIFIEVCSASRWCQSPKQNIYEANVLIPGRRTA